MRKATSLVLAFCLLLTLSAFASADSSPFVGSWKFYSQEGSMGMTHEEVLAMAEQGFDLANGMATTIRDDGTLSVNILGEVVEDVWSDNGDGTGIFNINGHACPMTVENGFLRVDMEVYISVFEKSAQSAEELAAATSMNWEAVGGYEMPEAEEINSLLVGDWRFYSLESSEPGKSIAHEELPELLEQGLDYACKQTLSIGDDGWFKITDFTGFEQNNWTDNGDNTGTFNISGENCLLSVEEGLLLLQSQDGVTRYERWEKPAEPEDLHGVVVKKLPGDFFPDRYQVLGDDGELYEGEYFFGFEDLEPGTAVILSWSHNGWSIEQEEDDWGWSDSEPEAPAGLYTTADGIVIDELDVRIAGGKVWSFGYVIYNTTDEDKTFDPSPFVLKTADGTEIQTAAPHVSHDEVWANNVTRVSDTILSPELVHLGDEISFWYDGVFLGTVIAREF